VRKACIDNVFKSEIIVENNSKSHPPPYVSRSIALIYIIYSQKTSF
jgi:hypothetical protein